MIIYKTTNKINGMIYIGKYCGNQKSYLGSGKNLKKAIKKYGKKNFTRETLEDGITDHDYLCEREIYWIKKYSSTDRKIGYNICCGGEGTYGYHHPSISRTKICKSQPKLIKEEMVLKILKMPKEMSQKEISKKTGICKNTIGKIKKGGYDNIYDNLPKRNWKTRDLKGKNNPMWGVRGKDAPFYNRQHTAESILKMRRSKSIKKEIVIDILCMLDKNISAINISKTLNVSVRTVYRVKNHEYDDIYDLSKED